MEKRFEEYNLDQISNKEHIKAIKLMFDDTLKLVMGICPDDLELSATGKTDSNRYVEVREKIKYGFVGYDVNDDKNKSVLFTIKKQLKGYLKRLIG